MLAGTQAGAATPATSLSGLQHRPSIFSLVNIGAELCSQPGVWYIHTRAQPPWLLAWLALPKASAGFAPYTKGAANFNANFVPRNTLRLMSNPQKSMLMSRDFVDTNIKF